MITDADEDNILKTVVPDLLYFNERESDKQFEVFCVIISPLGSTNVLP